MKRIHESFTVEDPFFMRVLSSSTRVEARLLLVLGLCHVPGEGARATARELSGLTMFSISAVNRALRSLEEKDLIRVSDSDPDLGPGEKIYHLPVNGKNVLTGKWGTQPINVDVQIRRLKP